MWPFEKRAAGRVDYTTKALDDQYSDVSAPKPDAGALAAVESSRGLWGRSFAAATLTPPSAPLMAVTPGVLGLAGRTLADCGEAVFLIDVTGDMVTLYPASSFDVRGSHDQWVYRVDIVGPNDTLNMDKVPAARVLHFRINTDPKQPWRGRSPLANSKATADLAARLEKALDDDAQVPVKRLVPLAGTPEQVADIVGSFKDRLTRFVGIPLAIATRGEPKPSRDFDPRRVGPEPTEAMVNLRDRLRTDILSAYGVPPGLLDEDSDAVGQRELYRRFLYSTILPIGKLIEAEIRAKLDDAAMLDFEPLRAADIEGRARAFRSRAQAAVQLAGLEGMSLDRALALAGITENEVNDDES